MSESRREEPLAERMQRPGCWRCERRRRTAAHGRPETKFDSL